jgi:hypothetical protein
MKFSCRFSLAGAYHEGPVPPCPDGVGAENVRQGAEAISRPSPQEVKCGLAPKAANLRKPDRRGRPVETHRQHGRTANHIWRHALRSGRRSPMTAHAMRRKGAPQQRLRLVTSRIAAAAQDGATLLTHPFPPVRGGGFHTSMQIIPARLSLVFREARAWNLR